MALGLNQLAEALRIYADFPGVSMLPVQRPEHGVLMLNPEAEVIHIGSIVRVP